MQMEDNVFEETQVGTVNAVRLLSKKEKIKKTLIVLSPLIGLVLLSIIYIIVGTIEDVNFSYVFNNIVNQSIIVAVIATGAIMIFALGSFDISLGASTLVSAAAGAIVYNQTNSVALMLLACIAVAVVASLFSSVLASIFNIPVFVTTVAMMSVLMAIGSILIQTGGGAKITVSATAMAALNNIGLKIVILVLFFAVCLFVFNFTKIGRRQKFLGSNSLCAKFTGISLKLYAIIAFAVAGIGVGLGGFLTVIQAPTITANTASSIGMNVIIAIVFGGMPLSGGARSKIYAAVIGAFSMTILDQTLFTLLATTAGGSGISQIVRAIIFLAIVSVAGINYRTKLLPR